MKVFKTVFSFILCLCLLLACAGCGGGEPGETTSAPTEAPSETTVPVEPAQLYSKASSAVKRASCLTLSYTYRLIRTVSGDTFSESREGTACYTGFGGSDPQAYVCETVSYGSYTTQYIESYLSGAAYARVNNQSFTCQLTPEEFLALQIPAVLLDANLYGTATAEEADGQTILTFADAAAPESWAVTSPYAELTAASGTATLDSSGKLTASSYRAEYTVHNASYILEVSTTVETPASLDLSSKQPVYPENCATLSDLSIPRYLLGVVGDVYDADSITATYTDTLYSSLCAMLRTQTGSYNTYGAGSRFMAALSTQVAVTDAAGITTTNTQDAWFRDGVYSYSYNGGDPVTDSSATADSVRSDCEDAILSVLLTFDAISSAELSSDGDFLCIQVSATESYSNSLCAGICAVLGIDLDSYADSYSTEVTGSYVTINVHTGLPTAMGMYLSRTHVKDGVSYSLVYQLDQAISIPSSTAYETITGEEPDTTTAHTAAPLFYQVTAEDGTVLWLLGTTYYGDGHASLPEAVTSAFAGADALAVEYDISGFEELLITDTTLQSQIVSAYYYAGGTTQDNLTAELYARAYPLLLATGCNSYSSGYMKVVIWQNLIEDLYLQQGSSLTAARSVDLQLLNAAKEQEKPIYEIESGLSQVQMLTGYSSELQSWLLEKLMDQGMIGYCRDAEAEYALWCAGDEAGLLELIGEDTSSMTEEELALYNEYYSTVFTKRNAAMLKAAKKYLSSGENVFCAVNVYHLLGEDGLIEALRSAGYTVELVEYN